MWLVWIAGNAGAQPFDDVSERLQGVENHSRVAGGSGYAGVALIDADDDGWLDLLFTDGPGRRAVYLHNDGTGHFTPTAAGIDVTTGVRGALAADLTDDGAPDLLLTGDLRAPVRMLVNDGAGRFEDRPVVGTPARTISAHAADIDGDERLDVYLAAGVLPQQEVRNALFVQGATGSFTDRSASAGIDTAGGACAATFTHFDDDDAIDLVVANCGTDGAQLLGFEMWHNQGNGSFVDIAPGSGVDGLGHWMGLAMADFDGDLRTDFFATNSGIARQQPHALYLNQGDGQWSDVAFAAGVSDWEFAWGTVAEDFDADGDVDLYFVGRSQAGEGYASPGHLFHNRGNATFEAPTPAAGPLGLVDERRRGGRHRQRRVRGPGDHAHGVGRHLGSGGVVAQPGHRPALAAGALAGSGGGRPGDRERTRAAAAPRGARGQQLPVHERAVAHLRARARPARLGVRALARRHGARLRAVRGGSAGGPGAFGGHGAPLRAHPGGVRRAGSDGAVVAAGAGVATHEGREVGAVRRLARGKRG